MDFNTVIIWLKSGWTLADFIGFGIAGYAAWKASSAKKAAEDTKIDVSRRVKSIISSFDVLNALSVAQGALDEAGYNLGKDWEGVLRNLRIALRKVKALEAELQDRSYADQLPEIAESLKALVDDLSEQLEASGVNESVHKTRSTLDTYQTALDMVKTQFERNEIENVE